MDGDAGFRMPFAAQNAEPEARAEMRTAHPRLIGTVAYFPGKYADGLIRQAFNIRARVYSR